jgi:hypothetical protein
MGKTKGLYLSLDRDLFSRLKKRAKKEGYATPQQYIYEVLRRNLYKSSKGGRKKAEDSEEAYLNKFSKPGPQTKKLMLWAKRQAPP